MSSVFTLKALGLNTMPNQLEAPEGSLAVAKNVTIQRDGVVEPRRGYSVYGDSMGSASDRAKQLINYKLRILRHYASTLQFDNNGSGSFTSFSGSISEPESGLRIKSSEMNGNLYFTSSEGIKKISALTSSDLSASSVVNAGATKAIDVNGSVKYTYGDQSDFFTQDSAVAYRVVWGYKDLNNNLILGTPSQRIEVYNPLLNLLIQDYMVLLGSLDDVGRLSSMISDQNYVNTLKLGIDAAATELRTNLISLVTKIDNDILYADDAAVAPLQISTSAISAGVCTVNFSSGDPTNYVSSGSKIFLAGFSPASGSLNGGQVIASVTSSTITFNTSASGSVTLATPTIVSDNYRSITQPAIPDIAATDDELVAIQTYISNIIIQLIAEPNAVIGTSVKTTYIDVLDVTKTSTVNLTFTIPSGITTDYFYQVYRSQVFEATGVQVLSTDVFPNDELQLVYEAFPTASDLSAGSITIEDITPDSFRGANLYTNASTGEGILQANDVPPFAKDINVFKNSVFYSNTHTRQKMSLSLIGVQNMIDDYNSGTTPSITIATQDAYNTYTFTYGRTQIATVTTVAGSLLAASGTASYFDIYSGNNNRSYRIWYKIGTAVAPAAGGHTLVQVIAGAGDNSTTIAQKTRDALNRLPQDFTASNSTNVITVETITNGYTNSPVAGTSGFVVAITQSGRGEKASTKEILLSSNVSPALAVQETALSLTRVLNLNSSEVVYVYYTSGAQEVPGQLIIEGRSLSNGQFFIVTNNDNTGTSFNPDVSPTLQISSITTGGPTANTVVTSTAHGLVNLDYVFISGSNSTPSIDGLQQITYVNTTTFRVNSTITVGGTKGGVIPYSKVEASINDNFPNRVYYSKLQQPEAVPVLNYFDVGAKDRAILRIFPLRDSLFVFKEDGLYRISGESIPFNLALFDTSCVLVAPDSVASVDNVIYGWTRQGVASVTESGTRNVSRPIDIDLLPLASASNTYFKASTWGIGYESDKSYTVYTIKKSSDTHAKQAYRYNSLTNTWTVIDREFVCGVINFNDDKMYVGAGDLNAIEKERKEFSREDYSDREYTKTILAGSINTVLNLDTITNVAADDVVVQAQTISIYDFNMLLKKLDIDSGIGITNFHSTLAASTGGDLRTSLESLAAKLDLSSLSQTNYAASIQDISTSLSAIAVGPNPAITSTGHGLVTGRTVLLAGTNSVPSLNGTFTVTVIDANTFTVNTTKTITTAGTTGTITTEAADFGDLRACYNKIITKLNADTVVSLANYSQITGTTNQEVRIESVNPITKQITISQEVPYIQGALTVYKAIPCELQYSPNTFGGDPVSLKHIREAQVLFADLGFTKATISFATDLLPAFNDIEIDADGPGIFGFSPFGSGLFGGISHSAPIRTYIPRDCQRCRYMVIKFSHAVSREKWSLYGITLTGETQLSARTYR